MKHLLKSAFDANMNMIRVWGGGLYESDYFYSLADSYGLLVWQDMTFTKATYPIDGKRMASMRKEAVQNSQRIAYHASLALIVTNNEIELYLVKNRTDFGTEAKRLEDEYKLLFMGNLCAELDIISRNDFSPRPGPMISTPSLGVIEPGKELAKDPQSPNYGDGNHNYFFSNSNYNNSISCLQFTSMKMKETRLHRIFIHRLASSLSSATLACPCARPGNVCLARIRVMRA